MFDQIVKALTGHSSVSGKTVEAQIKDISANVEGLNKSIDKAGLTGNSYDTIRFLAYAAFLEEDPKKIAVILKLASGALESYTLMSSMKEALQYINDSAETRLEAGDSNLKDFYFND